MNLIETGAYNALIEEYDKLGYTRIQLGTAPLETPIYAYDTHPGSKSKPLLVTAGAHAEEAAGVFTCLNLARRRGYAGRTIFVPCRDPLGWDGVRATFQRTVGVFDIPMSNHAEAIEAFAKYGRIIFDEGGMVICEANDLTFCSFEPDHPAQGDTGEFTQSFLRDREDVARLLWGKRLYVPGSPYLAEGRDVYGWGGGPTVYVDVGGRVGNFNRFFSLKQPPVEVKAMQDLADEFAGDYAFDLHENFGDRFGMYASPAGFDKGRPVYERMVDAVREAGFDVMPLVELLAYLDLPEGALMELYPGVYGSNLSMRKPPDAFGPYLGALGTVCFTTEMGLENALAARIEATEVAVRAGMRAIEDLAQGA